MARTRNTDKFILALNCGSSSVKFARFRSDSELSCLARGTVEGIGADAIGEALRQASKDISASDVLAVGHRVVHGGMDYHAPVQINDQVIQKLESLSPLAPLHQPIDLLGITIGRSLFPHASHVACFDTAFHRGHPFVHDTYGLARHFFNEGVRRYGFHGLSYEFIVQAIAAEHPSLADGKLLVAHLGSGASICAIRHGKSIASTMGFSALGGLVMGTRCGDLDPGVVLYLLESRHLSASEVSHLLYRESGLKGLSGISGDMRKLLASDQPQATEAIDYFVARCSYEIAGLASAIDGIDALIFTGGIGQNAWKIREKILDSLGWIGLEIDPIKNQANAMELTAPGSSARVLCLPTDEETMIGRQVFALSQGKTGQ